MPGRTARRGDATVWVLHVRWCLLRDGRSQPRRPRAARLKPRDKNADEPVGCSGNACSADMCARKVLLRFPKIKTITES